jgi:hypothetical protein
LKTRPPTITTGYRRDDQLRHHLQAGIAAHVTGPAHPFEHHPDIAPQIGHHGAEGPDMNGNVDHEALILPAGDTGNQNKMAGRADGQKFRKALDEGNHSELNESQGSLRR